MQVAEIMSKNLEIVSPDTNIEEVAKKMEEMDCGFLPVGDEDKLEGVITDRDIVLRVIARGKSPQDVKAEEALTHRVLYCFEADDIRDATDRMKEEQVYRLVVLNNAEERHPTGVITLGDISRQAHDEQLVGETAEFVAEQVSETKH